MRLAVGLALGQGRDMHMGVHLSLDMRGRRDPPAPRTPGTALRSYGRCARTDVGPSAVFSNLMRRSSAACQAEAKLASGMLPAAQRSELLAATAALRAQLRGSSPRRSPTPHTGQPPPPPLQRLRGARPPACDKVPALTPAFLNGGPRKDVVHTLYGAQPAQCSACGARFAGETGLAEHMDWHFERNKKAAGRTAIGRGWYVTAEEWHAFTGATAAPEPAIDVAGTMGGIRGGVRGSTSANAQPTGSAAEVTPSPVVATGRDDRCTLSGEKLEVYFDDALEEWCFKDAVEVDGKVYLRANYSASGRSVGSATNGGGAGANASAGTGGGDSLMTALEGFMSNGAKRRRVD